MSGDDIVKRLWILIRHGRDQGMKMNEVEEAAREIMRLRCELQVLKREIVVEEAAPIDPKAWAKLARG
jgi:hypothetical protein